MRRSGFLLLVSILCVGISYISPVFGEEIDIKDKDYLTRPTFGLSHDKNIRIVDYGFSFNNKTFAITNNFHTPFPEQLIKVGEVNSFEAKLFSDHGLKVQEFLFGIPNKGDAHLAEIGVEVWYDLFGEVQDIKVVQKSNVIDENTISATHQKAKCTSSAKEEKCDIINLSMVFLEPLKDKVMAIKAIDIMNRYQITYLNEGFDVEGDSLNPMQTAMIPSPVRNEGLIQVTQTAKYSNMWTTEDGRTFEQNSFGSFKQINQKFEQFQDSGEAKTRLHSGFAGIIAQEQQRATQVFDSSKLISELPESQSITIKKIERMDQKLKELMLEQEQICKKFLEESDKQARF